MQLRVKSNNKVFRYFLFVISTLSKTILIGVFKGPKILQSDRKNLMPYIFMPLGERDSVYVSEDNK